MGKAQDLLKSFNESRGKVKRVDPSQYSPPILERGKSSSSGNSPQYEGYLAKLKANNLDSFSTRDIMYLFRDVASRNGVKYIISKPNVDMRNFKLAIERGYTIKEILLMIEFLFDSEQDYLGKSSLHPGILLTGWCNRIYSDSQLWLEDKYTPYKQTKSKKKVEREWTEEPSTDKAKIGEWGDI